MAKRSLGCGCGFGGSARKFWIGRRCCVEPIGSGYAELPLERRCGRIVNKDMLRTDERGVPREIEGAYQPLRKDEVVLRLDNGRLISMFKNRLICNGGQ